MAIFRELVDDVGVPTPRSSNGDLAVGRPRRSHTQQGYSPSRTRQAGLAPAGLGTVTEQAIAPSRRAARRSSPCCGAATRRRLRRSSGRRRSSRACTETRAALGVGRLLRLAPVQPHQRPARRDQAPPRRLVAAVVADDRFPQERSSVRRCRPRSTHGPDMFRRFIRRPRQGPWTAPSADGAGRAAGACRGSTSIGW